VTPSELARLPLVIAALDRSTVLVDGRFEPGATITVGSNSKNDLVIPEKFELSSYKLISEGSLLHLAPPLHVQATVWLEDRPLDLKGFFRDLRRTHPPLPDIVPLASERFLVSYATGVSLMGRFIRD
jgi:hypothetical protein